MKKITPILLLYLVFSFACAEENPNDFNLTEVGQEVPNFTFTTLNGETTSINDLKGKIILINFFANWCSPCMKALPEVQKQIWEKFKDREVVVLAFGRGYSTKELKKWNQKKGFTFAICPDKDKSIYGLFFTKYIPRNVLINKEGKIILQQFGFSKKGLQQLIETIEKDLK